MKKKIAAVFLTLSFAGSILGGSSGPQVVFAQESEQAQDAGAAEAESEADQAAGADSAEAGASAQTEEESTQIPAVRPDYSALDYVHIDDDEYKKIKLSVYPPADDSAEAESEYQTNIDAMIMTQLYSLYPIKELPEDLLNYTVGNLTGTYREYANMYGLDFSTFLQTYLQQDETTFDSQVRKAAEQTLKEELLLKAVAEKENITLSDEEYEQGCAGFAERYGYESADALRQVYDESTIRISLLMDKTFDYLESVTQIDLIIETETESDSEALTEAEVPAVSAETPET